MSSNKQAPMQEVEPMNGSAQGRISSEAASAEVDPSQMEKMIAKEIEGLSLKERNAVYEEIHGVSTMALEESPELIKEALENFQKELDKVDSKAMRSYNIIANQEENTFARNIVQGDDLRLRFLRTEFFDAHKAANRMLHFLDFLGEIWGEDELKCFDGTMDFFLAKDAEQASFRMGFLQLLPFKDRSGRRILVYNLDSLKFDNETRLKMWIYLCFAGGEDTETQRSGMVMIFWPGTLSDVKPPNMAYRRLVARAIQCLPVRFASIHFCFPASQYYRVIRALISVALKMGDLATRVKVHTGEQIELQYILMGFGIPVSMIPATGTGTLKTKAFMQWLKARKAIETLRKKEGSQDESSLIIECPGVRDVIFRSVGKSCMLNPGNVALRGIFEEYHSEHIQLGQTDKKKLVWKIVEEIEARNGRFLVWEKKGWWVPLEDRNEIRNKVATSLRGYNKQRKTEESRQYSKSSTYAFRGQGVSEKRVKLSELSDDSSDNEPICIDFTF